VQLLSEQTLSRRIGPPAPSHLDSLDPRIILPPTRVGNIVTDPEAPGWTGVITWDPTYRNPTNWGYSRGLLMADEGGPNCLRETVH
jgi:hypothetical protein